MRTEAEVDDLITMATAITDGEPFWFAGMDTRSGRLPVLVPRTDDVDDLREEFHLLTDDIDVLRAWLLAPSFVDVVGPHLDAFAAAVACESLADALAEADLLVEALQAWARTPGQFVAAEGPSCHQDASEP